MNLRPLAESNLLSLLAEGAEAAAAPAGPDWWTLVAGGVGGLVVAAANHFFTRNRERGAWLRELQVEANRELYSAGQDLMTFVATANPDRSSHQFGWDPERLSYLIAALNHSVLKLMQVGEDETLGVSWTLVRAFPCLAYQALPLPGTVHNAGFAQRESAIQAMSGLLAEVAAVMRNDIGLLGRREYRRIKRGRAMSPYRELLHSPVDRPGANLGRLLWDWEVLDIEANHIPDNVIGYEVDEIDMIAPQGYVPQGCVLKPHDQHWRLAIRRDLHPGVKANIAADALRLITGHTEAFKPILNPMRVNAGPTAGAYVWFDVLS